MVISILETQQRIPIRLRSLRIKFKILQKYNDLFKWINCQQRYLSHGSLPWSHQDNMKT